MPSQQQYFEALRSFAYDAPPSERSWKVLARLLESADMDSSRVAGSKGTLKEWSDPDFQSDWNAKRNGFLRPLLEYNRPHMDFWPEKWRGRQLWRVDGLDNPVIQPESMTRWLGRKLTEAINAANLRGGLNRFQLWGEVMNDLNAVLDWYYDFLAGEHLIHSIETPAYQTVGELRRQGPDEASRHWITEIDMVSDPWLVDDRGQRRFIVDQEDFIQDTPLMARPDFFSARNLGQISPVRGALYFHEAGDRRYEPYIQGVFFLSQALSSLDWQLGFNDGIDPNSVSIEAGPIGRAIARTLEYVDGDTPASAPFGWTGNPPLPWPWSPVMNLRNYRPNWPDNTNVFGVWGGGAQHGPHTMVPHPGMMAPTVSLDLAPDAE